MVRAPVFISFFVEWQIRQKYGKVVATYETIHQRHPELHERSRKRIKEIDRVEVQQLDYTRPRSLIACACISNRKVDEEYDRNKFGMLIVKEKEDGS